MYPNPTSDFVNIDFPDVKVTQILLLDSRGKLIKNIDLNDRFNFNVRNLSAGVYFISIRTDQFVVTKRLLIVH